jgi:hypothetical protein
MHQVTGQEATERDRKMAQECVECSLCRNEREKQKGFSLWFLNSIEVLSAYARTVRGMRRCTAARPTK